MLSLEFGPPPRAKARHDGWHSGGLAREAGEAHTREGNEAESHTPHLGAILGSADTEADQKPIVVNPAPAAEQSTASA